MSKYHIAHIIGKWVGGGVESVVMNYYRHIDRSKFIFDFICDADSKNIPYDEIESLGGKVILIPPYQRPFSYHFKLRKILKANKYDIVHSHVNTMSVFPLFAAFCAGVKVRICHCHSTSNKKETIKNIIKNILRPFSKIFATDYMCCTAHAGKWLFGQKTYKEGKVFVLNNAIDLQKFKSSKRLKNSIRKKLNIDKDALVIGHIGRFVRQKNHEFIVDVFEKVYEKNNNAILILVGNGPLKEKIINKVSELNLSNNVIFLDNTNNINEVYNAFDLFIFPSLYEGLGMVLVEAQVTGLKCIASTEVPYEANVSNEVRFLPLSDSNEIWAKEILNTKFDRVTVIDKERIKKYDINIESSNLAKKYISLIEKS